VCLFLGINWSLLMLFLMSKTFIFVIVNHLFEFQGLDTPEPIMIIDDKVKLVWLVVSCIYFDVFCLHVEFEGHCMPACSKYFLSWLTN
jgi:hypothetical protein